MPRRKKSLYRGYNIIVNDKILSDSCPRIFYRVFLFRCSCPHEEFNCWESSLPGAGNGEICENPQCRGKPPLMGKELIGTTPIQEGERKLFAHFECHKCERRWCSAHSWANTSQKCRNCNIEIFPYIQRPLFWRRRRGRREKKHHDTSRCQACKTIDENCAHVPGKKSKRKFRGGRKPKRRSGRSRGGKGGGLEAAMARLTMQA